MSRILFITTEVPYPPTDGSKIRAYNIARILNSEYEVELLVITSPGSVGDFSHLRSEFFAVHNFAISNIRIALNGLAYGLSLRPIQSGLYIRRDIKQWISENAKRFDILFCHLVRTTELIPEVPTPKVVDLVDALSKGYVTLGEQAPIVKRAFYRIEQPRLRGYERTVTRQFDRALITTQQDKEYIDDGRFSEDITVVPNGVKESLLSIDSTNTLGSDIAFVGAMDYYPNVDAVQYFANQIFPSIVERHKKARFVVVGANPVQNVKLLGERSNVKVTGFVDDPLEYLSEAAVVVAPIRHGAGIQNKVLQAMAMGKPVVATPLAASGITTCNRPALMIADSDRRFAEKTLELLEDRSYGEKIGRNAKRVIESRYTWEKIASVLLNAVSEVLRDSH